MSTLTIKIKQYAVIFYISVYFSVYFDHLTEFPITRMPGCYLPLIDEKALNCKTRFNACIRDMLVFNNYVLDVRLKHLNCVCLAHQNNVNMIHTT